MYNRFVQEINRMDIIERINFIWISHQQEKDWYNLLTNTWTFKLNFSNFNTKNQQVKLFEILFNKPVYYKKVKDIFYQIPFQLQIFATI